MNANELINELRTEILQQNRASGRGRPQSREEYAFLAGYLETLLLCVAANEPSAQQYLSDHLQFVRRQKAAA